MVEIHLKKRGRRSIAKMLKKAEAEEKQQSIPISWGRGYAFTMPMLQTGLSTVVNPSWWYTHSTETWDSNT